ncbi:MAG: SDR family NAD(P)-dependent oxidoreductase [Acidimicrobiales bacterium]
MAKVLGSRVVIVTGAGRGLGRELSGALAREGAAVAVADIDFRAAEETAAAITATGGDAMAVEVDVASLASTEAMVDKVVRQLGRLDALVNNAGLYGGLSRRPFDEIDPDEWDHVMAVNAKGTWLATRASFPHLRKRPGAKVVNIASATFFSGSPLWAHYVASKGAVIGLTRVLAREMGQHGICVNAIAPGFTLTEASRSLVPDAASYGVSRGALARAELPEDVAGAVVFLVGPGSDFITGQCLVVDGGRQLQ